MAVAEAELGLRAAAHDHLHQAWSDGPRAPALNIDCATFCHLAYQAAQGIGETELAHQALRAGVEFIESAQPNVPEPFARSYRERNPVHAALLNAARQLAAT
jgi:hypothetical protein